MVVSYHQALSKRIKKTCNKFGVQVHFKGQTIKSLLMAPKDKDPITNKSGVIYRYKCSEHGCEEEYIGESARTFAERFKEHQKVPSPIFDHCNTTGHNININNFIIVGREDQNLTRAIKEALFIRVNDPSLNRNIGKYHLPHIWDEVLHKTSELKLKHWPSGLSICHFGKISTYFFHYRQSWVYMNHDDLSCSVCGIVAVTWNDFACLCLHGMSGAWPGMVAFVQFGLVVLCWCSQRRYPMWAIHYNVTILIIFKTPNVGAISCYVSLFLSLKTLILTVWHHVDHRWWSDGDSQLLYCIKLFDFRYCITEHL